MTEHLPAQTTPQQDVVAGLEDFGINDMVMPRLQINHETGVLVDQLSGLQYSELECVILGLVMSRVLWHSDPDFEGGPLCKSLDGKVGLPSHRASAPFPWEAAGMDPAVFPEGTGCLCESCPLSQWGSHPKGDTPWCTEQYNTPVLMSIAGGWSPALLTLQRSGLRAIKGYATSFARSERPMYTSATTISLDLNKKGSKSFAVPKFAQGADTDPQLHPMFLEQYRQIRSFLSEPRDPNASSAPKPTVTPTPVPMPGSAPAVQPAPAPAAAQPAPVPTPVAEAQPVAQPVAEAQPVEATPVAQPVVATPVAATEVDSDIGF